MANELVEVRNLIAPFEGMSQLPLFRQVGLLLGLAGSIALGATIVLWSRTPNYGVLFSSLDSRDQSGVVEELQKANIPYRIDTSGGSVLVPFKQINDARLALAKAGLPRGGGRGFEMLEKDTGFGTSELMENARYQHALEGELARSIQSINLVQAARVHLALPKQSAFLRNRESPSASVVVNLYSGRELGKDQVMAIRNIVAASVPGMDADRVTVVDQRGHLLSSREQSGAGDMALGLEQFEFTHQLEDLYVSKIENLLTPIVGLGGVRAEVAVNLDFSMKEQTQEEFSPDANAVRSEKLQEERRMPGSQPGSGGVPGALSNQPPPAATVAANNTDPANPPAPAPAAGAGAAASGAAAPATPGMGMEVNSSTTTMRNYEVGKTISHTRAFPGQIRRISAAIVVDDRRTVDEKGETKHVPLSEEEVQRLVVLVKDTIGFNEERGDSVQLVNSSFIAPPAPEPLPEPPLLKQPWVWDVGKQVLGVVGFLLLLLGVLRPVMHSLAARPRRQQLDPQGGQMQMAGLDGPAAVRRGTSYDEELKSAKAIVGQDPRRVAQVVKNWVNSDA
jgi:flagellar M-ring protein FliF